MNTSLVIKTKIQNISLLEQYLDNISDQICLDSSLYGVFCVVNDKIFEAVCQFGGDHNVELIFELESTNLVCTWKIEKTLYNLVFESKFKTEIDLIQHLVKDWKWNSELYQLNFCISNLGFHYRFADERRLQLRRYFNGKKNKYVHE